MARTSSASTRVAGRLCGVPSGNSCTAATANGWVYWPRRWADSSTVAVNLAASLGFSALTYGAVPLSTSPTSRRCRRATSHTDDEVGWLSSNSALRLDVMGSMGPGRLLAWLSMLGVFKSK